MDSHGLFRTTCQQTRRSRSAAFPGRSSRSGMRSSCRTCTLTCARSTSSSRPKGVPLYGPHGCGKPTSSPFDGGRCSETCAHRRTACLTERGSTIFGRSERQAVVRHECGGMQISALTQHPAAATATSCRPGKADRRVPRLAILGHQRSRIARSPALSLVRRHGRGHLQAIGQ